MAGTAILTFAIPSCQHEAVIRVARCFRRAQTAGFLAHSNRQEPTMGMRRIIWLGLFAVSAGMTAASPPALAQQQRPPNILVIMGDDVG